MGQGLVCEFQKVFKVVFSKNLRDIGKGLPSSVRSPGVAVDDKIPVICQALILMEEHGSRRGLGPAVDLQNCRIFLSRLIVRGLDHIPLHLVAVLAVIAERLWMGYLVVF